MATCSRKSPRVGGIFGGFNRCGSELWNAPVNDDSGSKEEDGDFMKMYSALPKKCVLSISYSKAVKQSHINVVREHMEVPSREYCKVKVNNIPKLETLGKDEVEEMVRVKGEEVCEGGGLRVKGVCARDRVVVIEKS